MNSPNYTTTINNVTWHELAYDIETIAAIYKDFTKESLLPIIERLENQEYFHGMFIAIAKELNERPDRIKRVYENFDFYKAAINVK